jgi:ADP-ribose pyrophosphatase YjhB (NUDIX family)
MEIIVRAAVILLEDNRMLLIKQYVTPTRGWSMPGGHLEPQETIEQCLIREWKEETGLEVKIKELLYVTDRFRGSDTHVVHFTFLLERTSDKPGEYEWTHLDPRPSKSSAELREIKMVPINKLDDCGFSPKFCQLVITGFPGRGSYKGDFHTFYGEKPG